MPSEERPNESVHAGGTRISDFWFARIELRLSRLESMVERLERHLWMLIYAAGAVLVIEGLRALAAI